MVEDMNTENNENYQVEVTEEQVIDKMYEKLETQLVGFDPTIIIGIITALIQIFSDKRNRNISLDEIKQCYLRKPRSLRVQLRSKFMKQGVSLRQMDKAIDAVLTMDHTDEEFQMLDQVVDNLI